MMNRKITIKFLIKMLLVNLVAFLILSNGYSQNILVIENDTVATFSGKSVKIINKIFVEHKVQKVTIENMDNQLSKQKLIIDAYDDNNRKLVLVVEQKTKVINNLKKSEALKDEETNRLIREYKNKLLYHKIIAGGLVIIIILII